MKKVLIISYFYPPANFVGGERTSAWAKHLYEYGYFPIVITRQWNQGQKDIVDEVINNELTVDKTERYEVHKLPFKRSLRNKLVDYPKLKFFQKLLTFLEVILSNIFIKAIPFSNFFQYTCEYIEKNPDVKIILISARPFSSFFIGYKLKKRYPKINWIADYRDDWTTGMTYKPKGWFELMIHYFDKPFEKKWLSNVSFLICPSQSVANVISGYVGKPGFEVLNGFDEKEIPITVNLNKSEETFRILYLGTLYFNQKIEILLNAVSLINEKVEVYFLGADVVPSEWNRLKELKKTYSFIKLIPRQPKEKVLEQMTVADVFFATAYEKMKGFVPVKCFDYLTWETPVILCPSDKDELKNFIISTSSGKVAENVEECVEVLESWIKQKKETNELRFPRNNSEKVKYSRKYQTKILAELLSKVTD